MSLINSKDKNTYLKLKQMKKKLRALRTIMAIYIKELISLLKDKFIHIGRFEAPCCHYRMIKAWFS